MMLGREHALYAISHDERDASTQLLREYLWAKEVASERAVLRRPAVFGPAPVFEQTSNPISKTISVTFKTSATMLRNLFPSKSYTFAGPDTISMASLVVRSYRHVAGLGNGGFEQVQLEIHGVQIAKADGAVERGTYVPIAFENSADSVLFGREVLGSPNVYSDINIVDYDKGASCAVSLSWKGVQWASIWVRDQGVSPRRGSAVNGHRDNDERGPGNEALNGIRRGHAGSPISLWSGFEFSLHPPEKLPTLHHIVARLAELPVFLLVGATISTGASSSGDTHYIY